MRHEKDKKYEKKLKKKEQANKYKKKQKPKNPYPDKPGREWNRNTLNRVDFFQ